MTECLKKYARSIGVIIGKNVKLDFIAYQGYNELLPLNFKYKVDDGKIVYKNTVTGDVYELHPNYRKYRSIVNSFKNDASSKDGEEDKSYISNLFDKLNIESDENDLLLNESKHLLNDLNKSVNEQEVEVKILKTKLNDLDEKYQDDIKDLNSDLLLFKDVNDGNMIEFMKLWERYRDMNKCKKEAKLMYQMSKDKLATIKIEMSTIINPINDVADGSLLDKSSPLQSFTSDSNDSDRSLYSSDDNEGCLLPTFINDDELDKFVHGICSGIPTTKITQDLIAAYDQ